MIRPHHSTMFDAYMALNLFTPSPRKKSKAKPGRVESPPPANAPDDDPYGVSAARRALAEDLRDLRLALANKRGGTEDAVAPRRRSGSPPTERAVLHEAGHALAAVLVGAGIDEVWVDGREGLCRTSHGDVPLSKRLVYYYAGNAATKLYLRWGEGLGYAPDSDAALIDQAVAHLDDRERESLLTWADAESQRLVYLYRDHFATLADALRREHRLSGARVHELLRDIEGREKGW